MIDLKHQPAARKSGATFNEDQEQAWVIQWAKRNTQAWPELAWLFHIPNGGGRTHSQGALLKLTGVKPGVPDLCLPVPRNGKCGLYVEMKSLSDRATASPEQKKWLEYLDSQNYEIALCRGFEAARAAIAKYLGMPGYETEGERA